MLQVSRPPNVNVVTSISDEHVKFLVFHATQLVTVPTGNPANLSIIIE